MRRLCLTGLGLISALTLLLVRHAPARAEEVVCQGTWPAVTVDNVRVPADADCTLAGTLVQGTLKVESGAALTAWGVTVAGNLQAEGARAVRVLAGSVISGSLQIKSGGAAQIDQARINGDLQFEANLQTVSATRSQVGGSVQVFLNLGGVAISGNQIDGNLQCKDNLPPPSGGGNVVQGNREDQCAALTPLELAPPDTMFLTQPPATTVLRDGGFTFSGSDDTTSPLWLLFECALDGAAFTACAAPFTADGLTPGAHQLRVRALDLSLNADPTPASYQWTIVAAQAVIDSGPAPTSPSASATFTFSIDAPGLTFECSLDEAAFTACVSPVVYSGLALGGHTFRVRAVDGGGNVSVQPASRAWTVAAAGPFALYLPTVLGPVSGPAAPARAAYSR
ncbi:MAG: hypothetical protein KA764_22245 [Anaerolineales bacterium]|nr:hypothetical protein [Anaerolineales bacterium]